MRKLRIIGVDTESSVVECEVPASGEKFTLPLDDRLRAAARGEFLASDHVDRPPVTGTLRPREIQERIRHGATAEEVATDAGVPLSRIEGFAVPVLLERANAADMAKGAHPMLSDGPSLDTLEVRLASALDRRGIDPDLVTWDAWRDRSGGWVVRTSWPAGLSDDAAATWVFVPDSHGGSARALDDEAEALLDPNRAAALRTVDSRPSLPSGPPPIRAVPAPEHSPSRPEPVPEDPGSAGTPATRVEPVRPVEQAGGPASADHAPARSDQAATSADQGPAGTDQASAGSDHGVDQAPAGTDKAPAGPGDGSTGTAPDDADAPPTTGNKGDDDEDFLKHPPAEPERRTSRRHPTMPSWEDVLLGVRGKDD